MPPVLNTNPSSLVKMLSPRKRRSMLLGAGKKRRQEGTDDIVEDQELESATPICLRSMTLAERAAQRVPLAHFSKPAPSKWDDAQKWIASPTSNRPKTGQSSQVVGSRKTSHSGYDYRQQSTKVVVEVPDKKLVPYEEPVDTKQIDSGQPKDSGVQKFVSWEAEPHPIAESYVKPMLMIETSIGQSAIFTLG
ncbi:hypothetical protein KY290_000257 [Solanum tuberosum]|uniref:Uncharacterized protein n=1 Tax=Solanum tuberosum TaxID=4113 RepID=A0ABQ7WKW3_SOLTU|nr:hypothetical protein KY290_000257 [Solanum tuberosum]